MAKLTLYRCIFLYILLLSQQVLKSQNSRWAYTGGTYYDENATDLLQSPDGGYVACITSITGDTTVQAVIKLDDLGNQIWLAFTESDMGESHNILPQQFGDGYILTGMAEYEQVPWLVHLDNDGTVVATSESWSSLIPAFRGLNARSASLNDSNYVVVSSIADTIFLYFTESEINTLNSSAELILPDMPFSQELAITDINDMPGENAFVITGNIYTDHVSPFIYIISAGGDSIFYKSFLSDTVIVSGASITEDNGLIMAGNKYDSSQVAFILWDTLGASGEETIQMFDSPGFKVVGRDIIEDYLRTAILVTYYDPSGTRSILLHVEEIGGFYHEHPILKDAGEIILTKLIGDESLFTNDVMCGSVNTFTLEKGNEYLIVHSDSTTSPLCIYDCVWPGDADNSGLTDMTDLLYVGLGYDAEEFERTDGEPLNYIAHLSTEWSSDFPLGPNYKYADCDGNSIINDDDTTAIALNYDLSHNIFSLRENGGSEYPLWLNTAGLSIHEGYNEIPIMLGAEEIPVDDIYGLNFTIRYDDPFIIDSSTVQIKFNDSWLGTADVQLLQLDYNLPFAHVIDAGVTRKDHNNTSGYGEIGRVSFVVEDNIAGMGLYDTTIILYIEDATGIEANADPVLLGSSAYSILIDGVYNYEDNNDINVYPNPLNGNILHITGSSTVGTWKLHDLHGSRICAGTVAGNQIFIPADIQLSNGEYILTITTDTAISHCKIMSMQ